MILKLGTLVGWGPVVSPPPLPCSAPFSAALWMILPLTHIQLDSLADTIIARILLYANSMGKFICWWRSNFLWFHRCYKQYGSMPDGVDPLCKYFRVFKTGIARLNCRAGYALVINVVTNESLGTVRFTERQRDGNVLR